NKIQSDTWVSEVSDLGDLEAKVRSFGWAVARCDGNDVEAFAATLTRLRAEASGRPRLIVADTVKGAGVSVFEPTDLPREATALYGFHSGAPSGEDYEAAVAELEERLRRRLKALGAPPLKLAAAAPSAPRPVPRTPERLVPAYGEA